MQIVLLGRRSYYSAIEAAVWGKKKKQKQKQTPMRNTMKKSCIHHIIPPCHNLAPTLPHSGAFAANGALGDLAALY